MTAFSRIILVASSLFLFVLLMPAVTLAKGPPIRVDQADPNFALQAENKHIKVKGSNLPEHAAVIFILNKPGDPEDGNTGQIQVPGSIVLNPASGDLEFDINVQAEAVIGDYDIEVIDLAIAGRKGKGTTLFQVQSKDGSVGNDDRVGRGMICTLNEVNDPDATLMDDGDPVYEGGVDEVLCGSGDVVGDHLSPIRFSNLPGGNPKQIKFAKRFLDLAFGRCDGPGCAKLPTDLVQAGSPDTAYVQVTPYADQNHMHLMVPREEPYGMALLIDPRDFEQRYSIQMSSRDHGKTNNFLCYADAEGYKITDDINVFVWEDGVSSGVYDGLTDGFTVTTGQIVSGAGVYPPKVSPDYAKALICSNIGPNGERCADRKNRSDLCFVLGTVEIQFTMHLEYK